MAGNMLWYPDLHLTRIDLEQFGIASESQWAETLKVKNLQGGRNLTVRNWKNFATLRPILQQEKQKKESGNRAHGKRELTGRASASPPRLPVSC